MNLNLTEWKKGHRGSGLVQLMIVLQYRIYRHKKRKIHSVARHFGVISCIRSEPLLAFGPVFGGKVIMSVSQRFAFRMSFSIPEI